MDECLIAGPIISWIVEMLKRLPVVKRYPRIAALIIAGLAGAARFAWGGLPVATLIECVLKAWGLSIATHEVLTEPVQRIVSTSTHDRA